MLKFNNQIRSFAKTTLKNHILIYVNSLESVSSIDQLLI